MYTLTDDVVAIVGWYMCTPSYTSTVLAGAYVHQASLALVAGTPVQNVHSDTWVHRYEYYHMG